MAWTPALVTRPPSPSLLVTANPPLTGERVSNLEELPLNKHQECIQVQTDKGTEVATNMVIVCNGIKINSFAYHRVFGKREAEPSFTAQDASSLSSSPRRPHRPLRRNWRHRAFPSILAAHLSCQNGDIKL